MQTTRLELADCIAWGLEKAQAEAVIEGVAEAEKETDAAARWRHLSKEVLRPEFPFALHQELHRRCFADAPGFADGLGTAPVWVPSAQEMDASNIAAACQQLGVVDWHELHALSHEQPERFWPLALKALGIVFATEPSAMLQPATTPDAVRWLPDAQLNVARSALEREGVNDQAAVIFQRPGGAMERRSLAELRVDAMSVAAALAAVGIAAGDAVAIDMPMTYESVAIYLGIVVHGAVVVSIADSFSASEIAMRLRIADAKLIFTQDVIVRGGKRLPLYERVCEADAPRAVVLPAGSGLCLSLRAADLAWLDFLGRATAQAEYGIQGAQAPSNILFSSGTTGEPKAIVWDQVTPIKAAADAWIHQDVRRGDVVCWPTNLGWMMGPWLIYASLLNGASIALYQGSPLESGFGAFVQDAKVSMLGVVPSLVKSWQKSGAMAAYDWSAIRCFSSTGEASTPAQMHWLSARAGYKPVIEYCGGTEIGGGYITGTVVQAQVASAFSTAAVGCKFLLIDEAGAPCESGQIALVPPMIGSSQRLLNRDHEKVYYENMPSGPAGEQLRRHGDEMCRLPGGYYRALGRVDDTMNLGGIKVSSAEIERVCNRAEEVHESAAIAVAPAGGGPAQLVLYAVASEGAAAPELDALRGELQRRIRSDLNPLFKLSEVVLVSSLPRTASNKVMRRVLRAQYVQG